MSNLARDEIHKSLSSAVSAEIADALLAELDQIHVRFSAADFRPAELSGGRFAEVCFRICEHACFGSYKPLGVQLDRTDQLVINLAQTPVAQCDETFRIHILRSMKLLYDLRNKRDVAHLGSSVSPNLSDSTLVLGVANWAASEVVRVYHRCSIEDAQKIVDAIVERSTPLVFDKDGIVRILDPSLSSKQKVLIALYHFHPESVEERKLFQIVEHSHVTRFRNQVLSELHRLAQIDVRDGRALILPPGIVEAESILAGRQ